MLVAGRRAAVAGGWTRTARTTATVPSFQGSCTGKFHYSDTTCDYGCLITEGLYWGVSSLLGAQEDRCGEIDDEWEPCTPALMRSDAPALSTLIDTMGITQLPDGNCDVDVATDDNAAATDDDGSSTLPAMATPTRISSSRIQQGGQRPLGAATDGAEHEGLHEMRVWPV